VPAIRLPPREVRGSGGRVLTSTGLSSTYVITLCDSNSGISQTHGVDARIIVLLLVFVRSGHLL
jgi:hypothetical protein